MRIAIAGFMHESNTFNRRRTDRPAFAAQCLCSGQEVIDRWRDAHHEVGGFIEAVQTEGAELVPLLMAWATPSGAVTDAVLDEVTDALRTALRAQPVDGLLLALHGAMVVESYLDGDGEVLSRIRQAVSPDLPIVVTFDLHGNLSQKQIDACTAAVAYRTCPHVDQRECGRRAAQLLLHSARRGATPAGARQAADDRQHHDAQYITGTVAILHEQGSGLEAQPGVLAVSLLPGFAYADVPQMGPSIVVVTDNDATLANRLAAELGDELWASRERFTARLPDARTAVAQALKAERLPVVLVDTGDNVGGGSAADGTVLLHEMLQQGATDGVVCLFAPDEVQQCQAAGVGQEVALTVGGKYDALHGEPVSVRGTVRLLHDGSYVETAARHGGMRFNQMGPTALVEITGRNLLVLTSQRHPPFSLGQLTCLGIEPRKMRLLVVKAAIAYKAAYGPIAGGIIEVDTPGLTAVNPQRFDYRHIRRPLYPLA